MPAKYSIKRNSLSSKWGIWANGTDAASTVEKLIAEVRSSEEAEAYCTRIEAGESHDAIMASFSVKKPKKEGGGIFGRFRKRAAAEAEATSPNGVVNNPVIEIESPEPVAKAEQETIAEAEVEQTPVAVDEAPSRFQVIEQPAPMPVAPTPEPEAVEPAPMAETRVEITPEAEVEAPDKPITREVDEEPTAPAVMQPSDSEGERIKMTASPSSLSSKVMAAFGRGKAASSAESVPEETNKDEAPEISNDGTDATAVVAEQEVAPVAEAPAETIAPESATPPAVMEPVAKAPVEPVAEAEKPAPETVPIPGPEMVEKPVASQRDEQVAVEPEVQSEPAPAVSSAKKAADPEPVATTDSKVEESDQNDGALVNWTFTPPPDVTPEELKASGQKAPVVAREPESTENAAESATAQVAEPQVAEVPVAPGPEKAAAPVAKAPAPPTAERIDPELASPAKAEAQLQPSGPVRSFDNSSVTVEIGISKALKDVTVGDPRVPDKKYNKVASQEYTEVSKAYAAGNSPETLHEELTHLAAVCLAWADAIEKRQAQKNGTGKKAA